MNARWALLWHSGQRRRVGACLGVLLGAVLFAAGLVTWAWLDMARRDAERRDADADQTAAVTATEDLTQLQSGLAERERHTRMLQSVHFDGAADRVGWLEGVESAARALHPLGYSAELGVDHSAPLSDAPRAYYDARGLEAPGYTVVDMTLAVQGVQEDELVDLLAIARERGGAVTRIEHCTQTRRADDHGLDAECLLQRFSIVRGKSPVVPLPPRVASAPRAPLPRVFYAPSERMALTAARLQGAQPGAATPGTGEPVRLDGRTYAGNGHALAWIDGHYYENGAKLAGRQLHVDRDGVWLLEADARRVPLSVGQPINRTSPARALR
jgi:hypothetical protein